MENGQPVPLWPDGTPGLATAEPQEVPQLTPYLVTSDQPRGAVIVCPGGGYARRAPHEGQPIAEMVNSHGIHGFVCDYRVAPYKHPWPLTDGLRAVRWVRHHATELNILPDKIAILGFSAGGHLAASVSTHWDLGRADAPDPIDRLSSRPDASILCYAVISFGAFGHTGSMQNLLGKDPDPELRDMLSNELQVNETTPPAFLWHTAEDPGVPVRNSLAYADALAQHKVRFELHVYPDGRHGLGLAPELPHVATWAKLCGEWLQGLGF